MAEHAAGGVDLGLGHGFGERVGVIGVVLEEIDIHVEGEEEGFVLFAQDLLEELCAGLLFEGQTLEGTPEATGQCDQRAHAAESTEEASNESHGGLLDVNATAPARAK